MPILTAIVNTVFKKTTAQSSTLPASDKVFVTVGQSFEIDHAFRVGQHCFVELHQPLSPVGRRGYFFLPHVNVPIEEYRGVWLTRIDSEVLHSYDNLRQGFKQLKALGFNTVYLTVWERGFTLYPSSVAEIFTGFAMTPDPLFAGRDVLAEAVELAQLLNLRIIPWFQYGLAALPNSQVAVKNAHLLTLDSNGNAIRTKITDGKRDDFVWFNPC